MYKTCTRGGEVVRSVGGRGRERRGKGSEAAGIGSIYTYALLTFVVKNAGPKMNKDRKH